MDEISIPQYVLESLVAQMTKVFYFVYSTDLTDSYRRDLPDVEWSPLATQTIEAIRMGEEWLPKSEEQKDDVPTSE